MGRPNVGKSTLFNRLIRSNRAITHDRPGVTRDRMEGVVRRKGHPDFGIVDTGGITLERVALVPLPLFQDPVEAEAIARAVANSGERCLLGGFIHSSNWDAAAMENLL